MSDLRRELPLPLPPRMRSLPINRGYPVPYFVTWLDNGVAVGRGEGEPDFRVVQPETIQQCVLQKRCWVCGGRLGVYMSFVLGPMCAVNRTSAEPPSHLECADWSARACPFLTRPRMRRNDGKPLPEGVGEENVAGIMLRRNPGVALVWTTLGYRIVRAGAGVLFRIEEPEHVRWYCEGRPATRAEVQHSIDTGLPSLRELAEQDGPQGVKALEAEVKRAEVLLPS